MVWDVKDSLAADTDAPYWARICHAGCGVCAPAARGRDRARMGERRSVEQRAERERRQRGGQSSRLPREDAPSWHGYGCVPFLSRYLQERYAPSWRLCYRSGAYHGLLLRYRQCEGMFDVPARYQPGSTLICCRSAKRRPSRAFFFCIILMILVFFSCISYYIFVPLHHVS